MEYVLMLVVSIALVTALAYQIFKPFQTFLKSYMGDYIACLLETGELPSLGNADTQTVLQDEGCNAQFQPATLANGRPAHSSSTNSTAQSSKSSSSSDDSSSSSSSSSSGSKSVNDSHNLMISSMKKTAVDGAGPKDGKVTEIPVAEIEGSKFYNRRNGNSSSAQYDRSKVTDVGFAGLTADEKKKLQRKESENRTIATSETEGRPPKKIHVEKPVAKAALEAEDQPLTFGNYLRILMIIAIVIALIMVLGSQALKIAKSQEK